MADARWQRTQELFEAARIRAGVDRERFLEAACADDPALLEDVRSLLAHEQSAEGFLDQPAALAGGVAAPGALVSQTFGQVRLLSLIGVGGMGEVYLGQDQKLGRRVAVKVLPAHLSMDPERRARFEHEARVLATFSHPHIASIYGLEEVSGRQALVLEYVAGDTLENRIARCPLSVADTLAIGRQIAEALDAAHEKGIVHRDLKPANIKVSSSNVVKVLDFGLAKATSGDGPGPDLSSLPTHTAGGTVEGAMLGTPRYMSPEQVRGRSVDKRSDIWAFGAVLYEMMTGRPAFPGATLIETTAAILEREPDWSALPTATPPLLRRLLQRCLEKDPVRRQRDIGDARVEVETILATPPEATVVSAVPVASRRTLYAASAVGLLLAITLAVLAWRTWRPTPQPTSADLFDVSISAPPGAAFHLFSGVAISPDGNSVAFITTGRLWVRAFTDSEARPIATVMATAVLAPYWSPDGRRVALGMTTGIHAVTIDTGAVTLVAPAPSRGGTWVDDQTILYGQVTGPIRRVSVSNGALADVTHLARGETAHSWPFMLPDRDHFLYLAIRADGAELRIGALSSPTTVSLGSSQTNATYAAGHLLFIQGDALMAQPFDLAALARRGRPLPLASSVHSTDTFGAFSASENGRLVTMPNVPPKQRLTWFTRAGAPRSFGPTATYWNLALSPDERFLAASMGAAEPPTSDDIFVFDLQRGDAPRRVTTSPSGEYDPVWSPDGRTLVFNSNRSGSYLLMSRPSSGEGTDQLVFPGADDFTSFAGPSFSSDGHVLLFSATRGKEPGLWTSAFPPLEAPKPFLIASPSPAGSSFSPDGRWVLYHSSMSGRPEVYLRRYPDATDLIPVSTAGGSAAQWRGDGREVLFLSPDREVMAVDLSPKGDSLEPGVPHVLFKPGLSVSGGRPFVVTKDGQRFLMAIPEGTTPAPVISLLVNWPQRLKQ